MGLRSRRMKTPLYVANSDGSQPTIMAYPVHSDGSIGEGSIFFDSWGDGLSIDEEGNGLCGWPG